MKSNRTYEAGSTSSQHEERELLNMFAGRWKLEGENLSGAPVSPNTVVCGETRYEWLPGGFFMVCKWDKRFNGGTHKGIGVMGYNRSIEQFTMNNYDNLGYKRHYVLSYNGEQTWAYGGDMERAVITFYESGNSYTENWERLGENGQWQPLCRMRAGRIK